MSILGFVCPLPLMFAWLDRLSDESHRSHRTAGWWHMGHAAAYVVLVGLYVGACAWHFAAMRRHWRT